jgi:hypothetical protein
LDVRFKILSHPELMACVTADFRQHVIMQFNRRFLEMNKELTYLALFLDPRYKAAVVEKVSFPALMQEVYPSCVSIRLSDFIRELERFGAHANHHGMVCSSAETGASLPPSF